MVNPTLNYPYQSMAFNVINNSDVDMTGHPLIDSEENCFALGSSSSLASYPSSTQVTFVQFKDSYMAGIFLFTKFVTIVCATI